MNMPDMTKDARKIVTRIISGGQTGADRAALDAAIALGLPHGGYVPADRRAEDGRVPEIYNVVENDTTSYDDRTERNVIESDGTLIVSIGPLTGGSQATQRFARRHDKPFLHVNLARLTVESAVETILEWTAGFGVKVLNVAGPRESTTPGIHAATQELLMKTFGDA
jgi:hypothetical protein